MGTIESDLPALYLAGELAAGGLAELPEEEARHVRALRLRAGDRVLLLDGRGGRAEGSLEGIDKRSVRVRVVSSKLVREESRPYIALGLGLISDKARFEWCIEKSVELGVREIIPIMTERSQGRFHRDRAERIAVSALKQSQRSFLPHFREVTPFDALLEELRPGSGRERQGPEHREPERQEPERQEPERQGREPAASFDLVCICHEKVPPEQSLAAMLLERLNGRPSDHPSDRSPERASESALRSSSLGPLVRPPLRPPLRRLLLLIGPEGGFSSREVESAVGASVLPVSISDARLRSETAAMVAVAVAESLLLVAN